MNWLEVIKTVASTGWLLYIWPTLAIWFLRRTDRQVPEVARFLRAELKPFSLGLLLGTYLPDIMAEHRIGDMAWFAIGLFAWYSSRHDEDDDDRWKRRKKKLSEKVAEVGGRLVPVPAVSPP